MCAPTAAPTTAADYLSGRLKSGAGGSGCSLSSPSAIANIHQHVGGQLHKTRLRTWENALRGVTGSSYGSAIATNLAEVETDTIHAQQQRLSRILPSPQTAVRPAPAPATVLGHGRAAGGAAPFTTAHWLAWD